MLFYLLRSDPPGNKREGRDDRKDESEYECSDDIKDDADDDRFYMNPVFITHEGVPFNELYARG